MHHAFLQQTGPVLVLFLALMSILLLSRSLQRLRWRQHLLALRLARARQLARVALARVQGPPVATTLDVPAMPRVAVSSDLLDALARGLSEQRRRCNAEAGYALVGRIDGQGPGRRLVINGLIDAGPASSRSQGHVTFDRPWQQARLDELRMADARASHLGDAHIHPDAMDRCSTGDFETDLANVRQSRSQEMVFIIATAMEEHRFRSGPGSICRDGLKLDVFYLGRASGYQYRKIRPAVTDEPMLTLPAAVRAFIERNPARAALDWACLRSLPGWQLAVAELDLEGRRAPALRLTHEHGQRALIAFTADGSQPPRVYVEDGGLKAYAPPFLAERWLPEVWFSQIVLSLEQELQRNRERIHEGVLASPPQRPADQAVAGVGISPPRGWPEFSGSVDRTPHPASGRT